MAQTTSLRRLPSALLTAALTAGLAGTALAQGSTNLPTGFVTGLRGFEKFHEPIGQPIYFESPFNDTNLRFLYLHHEFSDGSTLAGGDLNVYALQARLALSERVGLIATKDGYSDLNSGIIEDEGWNDLALGLKWVAYSNRAQDFVFTPGIRYQASNGTRAVLQGGVQEVSPFVSFAKGWRDLHLVGNGTVRVPFDDDKGNTVGHWDLHLDYDINPGQRAVFAPVAEVHGVHYLTDGATALNVGGLDYANLGSQPADDFVAWMGLGARCEIDQRFELGLVYEFALTDKDKDIMDQRITFDFLVRF
ncbi:MAG: hypothetical protein H6838_14710 [Planctomycetes bacterium]|nr:hypothetical protein [Planctomycetota bacterium]